jgi:D-cysteine desulfhydrase
MPRVADRLGLDLWIKRDDVTGGAEGGNKLRKLEFLMDEALSRGANVIVTGGQVQSNHARATAIVAASLGLRCELCLWSRDTVSALPSTGNALLDYMTGAHFRLVGPVPSSRRDATLREAAEDLVRRGARPYVIPEGGSNGVGALGYVQACRELRHQLDAGLAKGEPFDALVIACGSGGTAAGLSLGASAFQVAREVVAMAVIPDALSLRCAVGSIIDQVRRAVPELGRPVPWRVDERGCPNPSGDLDPAQRRFMVEMARCGLVLDPVYTGKALCGLARAVHEDGSWIGKRVLFVHTGGLPGLFSEDFGLTDV